MAIYTMSEDAIATRMPAFARARRVSLIIGAAFLVISAILIASELDWIPSLRGINGHLATGLAIGLITAAVRLLMPNRKVVDAVFSVLQVESVSIDSEKLTIENGLRSRSFRLDEILRGEEPQRGLGLYLRTESIFRWSLIPRRIQGYEEIKSILAARGIPIVSTRISADWVEFVLFGIVMGLMICELATSGREVRIAKLSLGIVVAVVGALVAHGRVESWKLRLQYTFFYSVPLIFGSLMLLLRSN